jgi:hypothetical protein
VDEQAWLVCQEPQEMLEFLRTTGRLSERKARLFAVACCHRIGHLLTDVRSQKAVEVAERYADGQASQGELEAARRRAHQVTRSARRQAGAEGHATWVQAARAAARAATRTAVTETAAEAALAVETAMAWSTRMDRVPGVLQGLFGPKAAIQGAWEDERRHQCALLRDIFGIPFHPISAIQEGTNVVKLAQAIYEERAFERLPVLADALEEAGVDDEQLLAHCRSAGPHARGCVALDAILGKS